MATVPVSIAYGSITDSYMQCRAHDVRLEPSRVREANMPEDLKDEHGTVIDGAAAVEAWLLNYAWLGTPDEQYRTVQCIMSQDGWKFIDAVADKFAGAQEVPGPEAFSQGVGFALSALYECHTGPHVATCPDYRWTHEATREPKCANDSGLYAAGTKMPSR